MEFSPDFLPKNLTEFERGYFTAAEWTYSDMDGNDTIPAKCKGFAKAATDKGRADCARFVSENEKLLVEYCVIRGVTIYTATSTYDAMECAGHDFWLSRNGHGAGFSDHGNEPTFEQLEKAARKFGETTLVLGNNRRLYFE